MANKNDPFSCSFPPGLFFLSFLFTGCLLPGISCKQVLVSLEFILYFA